MLNIDDEVKVNLKLTNPVMQEAVVKERLRKIPKVRQIDDSVLGNGFINRLVATLVGRQLTIPAVIEAIRGELRTTLAHPDMKDYRKELDDGYDYTTLIFTIITAVYDHESEFYQHIYLHMMREAASKSRPRSDD